MLTVTMRTVADLTPYARNARTHSDAQVAQIAASIQEFGWTNPILVDEAGGIIAGHGRLKAALALGYPEVPTIAVTGLTAAQKRALVLADNKLALNAGWDRDLLAAELSDLRELGAELRVVGFAEDELRAIFSMPPNAGLTDPDEAPEPPAEPVSRRGDLWRLGGHRLICGDATDRDVVATLMAGERAMLCFTSPPYGNQRDYTTGGIADWDALMRGVFARLPVADDGQVLVNLGLIHRDNEFVTYWEAWLGWMRAQGWRRFGWYVWDQGPGMPGDWQGRFAPSFEFVFHFNRASRKPNKIVPCKFAGQETHLRATAMRGKDGKPKDWQHAGQPTQDMRIPDSVIRVMRQHGSIGDGIDHPAVFPVALPEFVIESFTDEGDVVFEPFGGSGSTMLAAQRTGRGCRSVEIAPEYVDVAIRRFRQNHPDVAITLLATGQTFDEVAAARDVEVAA